MSLKRGGTAGGISLCMDALVSVPHLFELRGAVLTLQGSNKQLQGST